MEAKIIDRVRNWIEEFVIGLNLCPFAREPFNKDRINYIVADTKDVQQIVSRFREEVTALEASTFETSLIIISDKSLSFLEYLRIFGLCEKSLVNSGFDGDYQLASFHPDYQFADADYSDQSNFSNRSPFPIIHILRSDMVGKAIESYGDTAKIYKQNIELLEGMSTEQLKAYTKV